MPKLRKALEPEQRIESRQQILEMLETGEMTIGEAIRKMRIEWSGISQGRIGKIVGVSANTISAIERDASSANVKTLNRILRVFGMTVTIRPKQ